MRAYVFNSMKRGLKDPICDLFPLHMISPAVARWKEDWKLALKLMKYSPFLGLTRWKEDWKRILEYLTGLNIEPLTRWKEDWKKWLCFLPRKCNSFSSMKRGLKEYMLNKLNIDLHHHSMKRGLKVIFNIYII